VPVGVLYFGSFAKLPRPPQSGVGRFR